MARCVSGVGGQYNFVAMAHALPDARSILCLRATRTRDGRTTSNIIWNYAHETIPRHLRDIVITEYGIADLRAATDAEVIAALLNVADSRFQEPLLAQAKAAGKIRADYTIPERFRHNLPERVAGALRAARARGFFSEYPFGTDLTAEEIVADACAEAPRRAHRFSVRARARAAARPAARRAAGAAPGRAQAHGTAGAPRHWRAAAAAPGQLGAQRERRGPVASAPRRPAADAPGRGPPDRLARRPAGDLARALGAHLAAGGGAADPGWLPADAGRLLLRRLLLRPAFFAALCATFFAGAARRGAALAGAAGTWWPRSCSRMAGFSRVETSCVISSPRATDFSSRRMILPERVLGRLSAKRISSGLAMAPTCAATQSRSSFTSASISPVGRAPRHTTKANTDSPLISCGLPTTAASATRGCATSADSTSIVPRRCPATFRTSSIRPMIQK